MKTKKVTTTINLTNKQKRQIAKLAVDRSSTIENGTLHVYFDGFTFSILDGSWEYRDEDHIHVCALSVWNESKPYSMSAFMRQIEEYKHD